MEHYDCKQERGEKNKTKVKKLLNKIMNNLVDNRSYSVLGGWNQLSQIIGEEAISSNKPI